MTFKCMKNYIINSGHKKYFKLKESFEEINYDKKKRTHGNKM